MVVEKSCCYAISAKSSKNNMIALLIYKIEETSVPCEHPLAIMVEDLLCGFDEEKNHETGEMHRKKYFRNRTQLSLNHLRISDKEHNLRLTLITRASSFFTPDSLVWQGRLFWRECTLNSAYFTFWKILKIVSLLFW